MKGTRRVALALVAIAAIAAVSSLILTQMDSLLSQAFLRVELPERLRLSRYLLAPLVAGVVCGSFATGLFRTRRLVLPLAPTVALVLGLSVSWLAGAFHFHLPELLGNQQWRALVICLPVGGVLGGVVVKRLYPTGRA